MSYSETSNYNLRLPKIGNDRGAWGNNLNYNFEQLDTQVYKASRKLVSCFIPSLLGSTFIYSHYKELFVGTLSSVSYTHLTLPTN